MLVVGVPVVGALLVGADGAEFPCKDEPAFCPLIVMRSGVKMKWKASSTCACLDLH